MGIFSLQVPKKILHWKILSNYIYGAVLSKIVIIVGTNTATFVQILNKAVYISCSANNLENGMHSTILPADMGKK